MRVGLFPGTFDPVHKGHIDIALRCLESMQGGVWFCVCSSNPLKSPQDKAQRIRLLQLGLRVCGRLHVCDGDASTVASLRRLQAAGADVHVIMGEDANDALVDWHDQKDAAVMRNVPRCVFARTGVSSTEVRRRARDGQTLHGLVPDALIPHVVALYGSATSSCSVPFAPLELPSQSMPSPQQQRS